MKKYFFILIYFFINFNIFSLEVLNYSLDGDKILYVDSYKDFLIFYTETKEEICGDTAWSNFVYFFKKENNKFILDGYLSVNKAGKDIFEDTKDIARDIFNLMFSKGWYTLTPEEENKITKSYNKYSDKLKELS